MKGVVLPAPFHQWLPPAAATPLDPPVQDEVDPAVAGATAVEGMTRSLVPAQGASELAAFLKEARLR